MKILFISNLYPAYPGHSVKDVSYSLHYFTRQWALSENVLVIRPFIIPNFCDRNPQIRRGDFYLDDVRIFNCPVVKFPKLRLFYLKFIFKYLKKIEFYPDVVVAHLGFNLLFGYKIAKYLKIPLVSAVHQGDLKKGIRMLTEMRFRDVYWYSQGISCRSYPVYNKFLEKFPDLKYRCFVAYSGIERKLILDSNFAASKMKNWKENFEIRFISVCSLIQLKNIDINLKVLAQLNDKADWKYTIIGEGRERSNLEKLVKQLDISHRVQFRGLRNREEVLEEMKRSHIFIMVSSPETFGLVYLEAMATGNIVIGAKGEGIDGIIKNNQNGFLCAPGDQKELQKILNNIIFQLNNDELKRILIQCNLTIQEFTEEKAANNYLKNIYKYVKK